MRLVKYAGGLWCGDTIPVVEIVNLSGVYDIVSVPGVRVKLLRLGRTPVSACGWYILTPFPKKISPPPSLYKALT